MANFNANSINQFVADMKTVQARSTSDKFADDAKYNSLLDKWVEADRAHRANPNDTVLYKEERKRRKLVDNYVKSVGDDREIASMPLKRGKNDREKEIENCLAMVYAMAVNYGKRSPDRVSVEDLIQFGMEGLCDAANRYFSEEGEHKRLELYKEGKDAKFSTYAADFVKAYIIRGVSTMGSMFGGSVKVRETAQKNAVMVRSKGEDEDNACPMETSINERESVEMERNPDDEAKVLGMYMRTIMRPLSKYEKKVMFLYLGIDTGGEQYDTIQIGKMMNVHNSTISREIKTIYAKMQRQARLRMDGEQRMELSMLLLASHNVSERIEDLKMSQTYGFELEPKQKVKIAV